MNDQNRFQGPLFIVGVPRSGTKLLLGLLGNHPLVAIPGYESGFIPYYLRHLASLGPLDEWPTFQKIYREFNQTRFWGWLQNDYGFEPSAEQWYAAVQRWSAAGIIEAYYLLYAQRCGKRIWGDKTPYNMLHLPLLADHFQASKFIHIIRDARDQCLSAKKAWNKHIYRSAQRWHDAILKCRKDGEALAPERYFEIRYEALIDAPEASSQALCRFIGIPFEPQMIHLDRSTEELGDAREHTGILPGNYQKWKRELRPRQVRKIEKICGSLLSELGYAVSYGGKAHKVGAFNMTAYRAMDALNQIRIELKRPNDLSGMMRSFKVLVRNAMEPKRSRRS